VVTSATGTGTRVVQGVPGDALDNEINPAGTQIALTTLIGNEEALAIVNSAGGGLRTIARAVVLRSPVWTPDGTRLIFSQFDGENAAQTGIFQINADGTNKIRLNAQENAFDFDFSPDGSTIAFTDDSGAAPIIRLMNANGSNIRTLPINLPNSRIQSPSFSPDGSQIVFAAGPVSDAFLNLYRVPAAGGTPTMITSTPAGSTIENDSPDWR
jgi:TolB protein